MKKTPLISRFRRSSKAWLLTLALLLGAAPGFAQQAAQVLTIDLDRLFAETRLGAETLADLERQAKDILAENAEIESALIAEERELTDQRSTLQPDEFRTLADAFDERVQRLRAEQDDKERLFNLQQDEARAEFYNEITELLADIVREKGAVMIIERRDVFLSAENIDITDEAIERINESQEN